MRKHVVWAIKRENRFSGSTCARSRERKGQDNQKKSQGGNISPTCGEAPNAPIETKLRMVSHLADVITYAKFQVEIFTGYDVTGCRISHFRVDFCMGLTTVILPVILQGSQNWRSRSRDAGHTPCWPIYSFCFTTPQSESARKIWGLYFQPFKRY